MVQAREAVTRILESRDLPGRDLPGRDLAGRATPPGEPRSAGSTAEQLFPLLYDELHLLARRMMGRERRNHTLQATAVVNEAYLRLVDQTRVHWQGRSHFLAVASVAMRRLLIEHARARNSLKRGHGAQHVSLHDGIVGTQPREIEVEALEEALQELGDNAPRKARVVEMKFFAGMTTEEIATELGVTPRTVERDWHFARAWLLAALGE